MLLGRRVSGPVAQHRGSFAGIVPARVSSS
jgi:hypothetical protein